MANLNNTVYESDYINTLDKFTQCRWYTVEQERRLELVMDYNAQAADIVQLPALIASYVTGTSVDKISVRVPGHLAPVFFEHGYQMEASLPHYYCPGEPLLFLARLLSARRALASRGHLEAGYELEFRYGITGQDKFNDDSCCPEILDAPDRDVLEFCHQHQLYLDPETIGKLPVIIVRQGQEIEAAAVMVLENAGRIGRIDWAVGRQTIDRAVWALLDKVTSLAHKYKLAGIYSFTSDIDEEVNRVLPALGFRYRGKLGADIIRDNSFGDRYVWSRNL